MFKTDYREQFGVFSLPWHIDLAHQIIFRKSTYEQLGKPESISLIALIGNRELSGGVELGRSYSNLDTILVSPKDATNIMTIPTLPGRILSMLNAKRIDYIIEYPYVASHSQKELGLDAEAIVSVPIEEINDFAFTRVGCPNTDWGKEVIAKTNLFIRSIRGKKSYLEVLKMIHVEQEDRELVERVYHEHFVNAEE